MSAIIVPAKLETDSVRRGRVALVRIMQSVAELQDRGKNPTKVTISTAMVDDLRQFFDYAYDVFDGVLPQSLYGVPIVYEPGAGRDVRIDCNGG